MLGDVWFLSPSSVIIQFDSGAELFQNLLTRSCHCLNAYSFHMLVLAISFVIILNGFLLKITVTFICVWVIHYAY